MSYDNEDEYEKNELEEVIKKRNKKYHKVMQKGNCCRIEQNKNKYKNFKNMIFLNNLSSIVKIY